VLARAARFSAVLALLTVALPAGATPTFASVKAAWRPSEAWLLDRDGVPLQELRLDAKVRRTDWTALDDISPAFVGAVLHAEDKRFFEHGGVDWLAAGHAALGNLFNARRRGASTLSMQLAALIDADLRAAKGRRGLTEKWQQMQAARDLEKHWSKPLIFEAYANLIPLRGDLVGIDAASRALFDKRPAGLTPGEAIVLAALIRAPNAPPAEVARRTCALGAGLAQAPDCAALNALTLNSLTGRHPIVPAHDQAPHLAARLLDTPGERRPSSLVASLQDRARAALDAQLARLGARNVHDAAALVLDNASGQVLAYVSRSGPGSDGGASDGVQAPRQAGSTLKPFLYALAIDKKYLTAASALDDSPLALGTSGGQYIPENYDRAFRGQASVRQALAGSLNIPAVRALQLVGEDLFANRLQQLGFAGLREEADFYGPALALGSLDVSLWQLTNAYRALANGGLAGSASVTPAASPSVARTERSDVRYPHSARPDLRKATRVFSPEAAYIVADILADRQARAATFGLENALATRSWTAVKTGTSKDMRDNWCVGFSDRYSVGVWVGNFDGSPMHDVSGVSGAAPAWRDIMDHLHSGDPSDAPKAPPRLVRRKVAPVAEAPRREWFLPGTEAGAWTQARPPAEIVSPGDGMRLAWDPDIPADKQRIGLKALHAPAGSRWRVDGQDWPDNDWPVTRGKHAVALLDAGERELDRVEFEVR
jgi:penicillin-binding protein 1C